MFKHTVTMDTYNSERIKQNPSSTATVLERRITADQILHICRLLTDQRNESQYNKRKCHHHQDNIIDNSMEIQSKDISSSRRSPEHQDYCDRLNNSESHQDEILSDGGNVNTSLHSVPIIKQAKKDILNKIRNQIFERKRQKLATVQQRTVSRVWRPW